MCDATAAFSALGAHKHSLWLRLCLWLWRRGSSATTQTRSAAQATSAPTEAVRFAFQLTALAHTHTYADWLTGCRRTEHRGARRRADRRTKGPSLSETTDAQRKPAVLLAERARRARSPQQAARAFAVHSKHQQQEHGKGKRVCAK